MTDTVNLNGLKAQLAIIQHCKQKRAELDELEANAKAAIQAALGEAEVGTIDGRVAVRWTTVRRNTIDQKLLKQRHPDIAAEVMTVSESRRFTIENSDAQ